MSNYDQKVLRVGERIAEALEKIIERLDAIRWELKQRRLAKPKDGDN